MVVILRTEVKGNLYQNVLLTKRLSRRGAVYEVGKECERRNEKQGC
jgi:hypothetical protein